MAILHHDKKDYANALTYYLKALSFLVGSVKTDGSLKEKVQFIQELKSRAVTEQSVPWDRFDLVGTSPGIDFIK